MSTTKTVQNCIDEGEALFAANELFYGHGTDNPGDEAFWLVFYSLGLPWDSQESILQQRVNEQDYQTIQALFQRRVSERIPAAYITGEAWFAGIPFIVNQEVLIPRSPISELINEGFQPWLKSPSPKILDLCTGCGCIGIASALYLPDARVTLSDISPAAIEVARQNIQSHGLEQRVDALESDGFQHLSGETFDLIVSNPPYVDAEDFSAMPAEYRAEPELALVSGQDGLEFTRMLLKQAASHLNPQGILIVEVGNSWVNLEAAFPQIPFLWLAFEIGGHGVFVMTREELEQYFGE